MAHPFASGGSASTDFAMVEIKWIREGLYEVAFKAPTPEPIGPVEVGGQSLLVHLSPVDMQQVLGPRALHVKRVR
jgi:hypothetical protein